MNIDISFVVDDDNPWILIQQEDWKIWFDFEEAPHLAQCFEALRGFNMNWGRFNLGYSRQYQMSGEFLANQFLMRWGDDSQPVVIDEPDFDQFIRELRAACKACSEWLAKNHGQETGRCCEE